jgi:hypothetical protein
VSEVVESESVSEVELGNLSKVNQAQSGVKRKPDGNKVGMLDGMELGEELGSMERRLLSLVSDSTLHHKGMIPGRFQSILLLCEIS